jgi:hypothetical protein
MTNARNLSLAPEVVFWEDHGQGRKTVGWVIEKDDHLIVYSDVRGENAGAGLSIDKDLVLSRAKLAIGKIIFRDGNDD